jgi:nucleoside-diphosphate-sugar epimerase
MRIFLAGATGVIGLRLVELLVESGHHVAGMTRSLDKEERLAMLGVEPVVCDVYDADGLRATVVAFRPEVVMHQLTDLPDELRQLGEHAAANARIRREGTANLLGAAQAAGASRVIVGSVAWALEGDGGAAVEEMEARVLGAGGVIVRYGRFYGPGTFYETDLPPEPRVHIDTAARRTMPALNAAASSVVTVVET